MRVILQLKNGSSFKYVSVIIDDTVVYYMWLSPNSEAWYFFASEIFSTLS